MNFDIDYELLSDYANDREVPEDDNEYIEYPRPSNQSFKLFRENNGKNILN
jgi:hypothetical protein